MCIEVQKYSYRTKLKKSCFDTKKNLTKEKSLQFLGLFPWAKLNRTALHCDQRGNAMFQKKRTAYIIKLNLEFVITMNLIRKKEIWTEHAKSRTYEWCLAAAGQPPSLCYWFFFVINLKHKVTFFFWCLKKKISCKMGSTHLQSITTFVSNLLLKNEEHFSL